jgi:hypothetical protein
MGVAVTVNHDGAANVSLTMITAAHRTFVLAATTSVAFVLSVPAFAQSNNRTSATAVREYAPVAHVDTEHASPPPNFTVAAPLRPTVALMLRRSPTFRRQCQRIANAPHLIVALRRAGLPMPHRSRARSQVVRPATGLMAATIDVPPLDDDVELIAHELEHVIEQLDDVDLATAATRTNTGVVMSSDGQPVFETRRAIRVGLLVAEEVRRTDR